MSHSKIYNFVARAIDTVASNDKQNYFRFGGKQVELKAVYGLGSVQLANLIIIRWLVDNFCDEMWIAANSYIKQLN